MSDNNATLDELRQLAAWSGWGAVPQIFDEDNEAFAAERRELRSALSSQQWDAARRTTINAHYTDPAYVAAIWSAMRDLGFTGGRVLEPGCGSGTFIGLAPAGTDVVGVELDPVTADIASQLYPDAQILSESFADTRISGGFDAVVGNVPFAEVKLSDPVHNVGGHSMHNHFLIKSLALTKPGGIVAALTSRYTLDAQNPAARRELAELGDLVGAVRLPTGAHRRTAGTEVVTDLLVLRRRELGRSPDPDTQRWLDATTTITVDDTPLRINQYFVDHPEQVLGTLGLEQGMFARADLVVRADGPTAPVLTTALDRVVEAARARDLLWSPAAGDDVVVGPAARIGAAPEQFVGHISETAPLQFTQVTPYGTVADLSVPRTQAAELSQLLRLRDAVTDLLQAEANSTEDTDELSQLRARLNTTYDTYAARYGPLNRFTERRTGRNDPETGAEKFAQIRPPVMRIFAGDPFGPTVAALEVFDAEQQTAAKAAIMRQRVVMQRRPPLGADTPADALAISLDTYAEARLDAIADLLGVEPDQARVELTGLVFDDPSSQQLVPAAAYLSGNVRTKLAAAVEAAAGDERYSENVDALRAVIPADLTPGEVDARLGAAWIGPEDVQAFLRETLGDSRITVEHIVGSPWKVSGGDFGVSATSTWGTVRFPATRLAQQLLRQGPVRVMDHVEDGPDLFNPTETEAANEKAQLLNERFSEWVWEDPARADRLARIYNDQFNAIVLRSYDTTHMRLPGIAHTLNPQPHQRAAVARMIAEPTAGLFHEVGAGKTAEMTIGVMELRRLGLVNKPAIVVPNHMLGQFSSEFLQWYPQAKVLAASIDDLAGDKRRAFVARATTCDWDAIIMTRTAFEKLPLSPKEYERYLRAELAPLQAALENLRSGDNWRSVKQVEKVLIAHEERIKKRLQGLKDPGVTFEQTGIDYLVVDELHDYKNLLTPSNIQDAAIVPGSGRASDLHMKVEYLRSRYGGRAFTGATATPIANSVTEAYVMQRYLRPDLLAEAGISDFDTWAATFGETVTEMEVSPTGAGWRQKTRFAKFRNIPEFLRMWHVAADIKTADDLNLPTPDLTARPDGQRAPQTIVVEPSDQVVDYVKDLGERVEKIRMREVEPSEDNMLKVSSDGRQAALDMRLVTGGPAGHEDLLNLTGWSPTPSKVDVAAGRIAQIWADNTDRAYLAANGERHPRPGALQLVFSDLGTPREEWNVYDELKTQLVERGVPPEQVAFIHSAKNDRDKAALFEAARTGRGQVLIGSTQKMGVGTNVQARAIALHHLDCPWRPADLAQREGRIVRQGNQNPEVQIHRYVTEGTFDTYSWQTVERKARFIAQVMKGRLDTREIEDIGDAALSYNEVKALASGNPLLLDKAQADADVGRLQRLERAHSGTQRMLRHRVDQDTTYLANLTAEIPQLEAAIAQRTDTRGDAFKMQVGDRWYSERTDAAHAVAQRLNELAEHPSNRYRPHPLGHLGGHALSVQLEYGDNGARFRVSIDNTPIKPIVVSAQDTDRPAAGLAVRFENALATLDRTLATTQALIEETREEITRAQAGLGQDFPHREALDTARTRRSEIAADAQAQEQAKRPAPAAGTADPDIGHSLEALASMQVAGASPTDKPAAAVTTQPYTAPTPDRDTSPGID